MLLSCCIADVLAKNKLSSKSKTLHEYRRQDPPQREGFLLQRALLRFPYNRFLKACLHCEADSEAALCGSETSQLLGMNSLSGCSHFWNMSAFLQSDLVEELAVEGSFVQSGGQWSHSSVLTAGAGTCFPRRRQNR